MTDILSSVALVCDCGDPATAEVTWDVLPTARDDGKRMVRCLCGACLKHIQRVSRNTRGALTFIRAEPPR